EDARSASYATRLEANKRSRDLRRGGEEVGCTSYSTRMEADKRSRDLRRGGEELGSASYSSCAAAIRRSRPPWRAGELAGSGSYSSCAEANRGSGDSWRAGRPKGSASYSTVDNAPCAGILGRTDFIIFIVGGFGEDSTYCSHRNDHCCYAETGGNSFRDHDSERFKSGSRGQDDAAADFQCRTLDRRRSRENYQDLRG